ncbi:MAG: hypothetical protein JSV89_03975 [Spirochaetaceae bacterium]|nr:MAG: hypothetical protein JSV89_03975 [Spirochaetaceae bacterium]
MVPLKRIVFLLLLGLIGQICFSADEEGVTFQIRFYEKRIYYLNDREHPIFLEATLTNNSGQTYRFKMAENRMFNFDFEVTTPTNILLDHSQAFSRARTSNQPVLYREISLEPGDAFGVVIALEQFIEVPKAGLYSVQALFFPELRLRATPPAGGAPPLRSNLLTLSVRPEIVFEEERAMIEAETGKLIQRQPLPPDEVVSYMLSARQRSQWEKFFLYLDLESLYQKNTGRAESYRRMSEENRRAAIARYKEQLRSETVDVDILVIPAEYEVVQTSYTPLEAEVTVIERFQYRDYIEVKRYTYFLERRDIIWVVTDYEIVNLGTE